MGYIKEKEIMPTERIYTIRGQNPATATHKKIQLSSYDPTAQYQIIEFKLMPAGTATNTNQYGILTMGKNDTIVPSDPDFADQNQIAWAHNSIRTSEPPAIGESQSNMSNYEINDEKIFAYDLWLHTQDRLAANAVNYFIKIMRYSVSEVAGSIASLRQFQYNEIQ